MLVKAEDVLFSSIQQSLHTENLEGAQLILSWILVLPAKDTFSLYACMNKFNYKHGQK